MPHSFATTANLTCNACTRPFSAELWLIVDTVERPDLLARIREGVLHDVPCPHCGTTNNVDAPLLAYRPDREPTLVFSPRWASDDATQQADAQELLDTLKANLGAAWDDRWLAEADTLPAVAASAPAAVSQNDALFNTLVELINAASLTEKQHIVEADPALLSDAADALLVGLADVQDDEGARRAVTAYRELLRRCKTVGVARAFAEQSGGQPHRPEIPPALRPFINELTQLTERSDMPRRIALCRQALELVERSTYPQLWAALQDELGNSLSQNPLGNRSANLEQAIAAYEQALQVCTQAAMPIDWAQTMQNLATAYLFRIHGERAANLEQAIATYEQALQVMTRDAMPIDWAQTMMNLANAYYSRIRGERAANLEQAIATHEQALQARMREAMPIEWAQTMMNLALAYDARILGERAANLEQAIAAYEQALQVITRAAMPFEWAGTINNLANAYRNRIRGERAANLEQAIAAYEQALQVRTRAAMPIEWAQTMMNLAVAYAERIRGERTVNLEQAIAAYEQALQVRTREAMPIEWATTMNNWANAYLFRIRGERAVNLEQAIAGYEQALTIQTKDTLPADYRDTQRNLGRAYLAAHQWANAATALQEALAVNDLLYAAAATPEARQAELRTISGAPAALAYALAQQQAAGVDYLAAAAVTLERNRARWLAESIALRRTQPAGVTDAHWQHFLAAAETMRMLQTESQLADNTPGKRDFLTLTPLLAAAREALQTAIAQVREQAPDFMPEPSFAELQATVTNGDALVYLLTTEQGGLALIVHAGGVESVWLDLTDARLREWLAGPPEEAQRGGWLGAYQAWLQQRTRATHQAWFDQIETTTRHLWDALMGPVADALYRLAAPPQSVTLIPTGLLALLPLHAAWTDAAAARSGDGSEIVPFTQSPVSRPQNALIPHRHYFLDDFAVRYAPSALALRHAQERLATVSTTQVLAIDEPKPVNGNPLPNSAPEVSAIVDHFSQQTTLAHAQATRQAVLDALAAGVDVAHFSCHGRNDWGQPLETGLYMAHDTPLTVRDLLELRLPGARLATLSACETGIAGTTLPDEVVMLPSALLQAGFAGVAASLWSVADVSTAMLMARFYDLWQSEGVEPVYALRQAQQWVRDTTNQEKADYFAGHVPELQPSAEPRMAAGVAADFFNAMELHEDGPEARTFAHPFWWAAFTFTGV